MESKTDASGADPGNRAVAAVSVADAAGAQRPLLDRLLQLYLHDFSGHALLGSRWGEVDESGRFAYPSGLDAYWQEPGRVPLLIRADGRVAGFALLNQWSALELPVDRAVAEFFVLRKYRRARVGTRAAHLAFRRYPGRWEVAVAGYNPEALLFWRSAVGMLAPADLHERPGDGRRWSGMVLCFQVAAPP